jgi:hypothetical protein
MSKEEPTLQEDLALSVSILAGIIEQASDDKIGLVEEVLKQLTQAVEFKKDGNKSLKNQLRFCEMLVTSNGESKYEY